MALVRLIFPKEASRWAVTQPTDLAKLGTTSLCLTLLNIMCIFLTGVAVYKIKEVCPLDKKDIPWWRRNSNFLRNSKRNNGVNDGPTVWDTYKKITPEPVGVRSMAGDTKPGKGFTEANTVTHRRHSTPRRHRSQYFYDCYREKPHVNDNYVINSQHSSKIDEENAVLTGINVDSESNVTKQQRKEYVLNNRPTMEMSMNDTLDSDKRDVLLDTKYNV